MRYQELHEEIEPEWKEIAAYIKNDCQQFLQGSNEPLYRGFNGIRGSEPIDGEQFYHIDFRDNRKPYIAHPVFFDAVDKSMKRDGFEATRSNSDLFSGSRRVAASYGNLYACFPLDGFKFSYSNKLGDYLNYTNLLSQDEINDLQEFLADTNDIDVVDGLSGIGYLMNDYPYEVGIWYWDKFRDTYKKEYISLAIDSGKEVMVTGPSGYYALDEYTYRQMENGGLL